MSPFSHLNLNFKDDLFQVYLLFIYLFFSFINIVFSKVLVYDIFYTLRLLDSII